MFDVGFSEMLVIGIVALLVIGPEKLPSVARTVGALLGRMQRYVNDVKADINREIEIDELKKLQTTVQDAAKSIETSMTDTMSTFQTQADELNKLASGDIAGLTETKAPEAVAATAATQSSAAAGDAPALAQSAAAQADAFAMMAAAEAAPGPAAIAESASANLVQSGSQSGSQGMLPLEPAPTNASGAVADAKSGGVAASLAVTSGNPAGAAAKPASAAA